MKRGDDFEDLTPCRVIFFLSFTLFEKSRRLHSRFCVLETEEHHRLTNDLELHFVELSKLEKQPIDAEDSATPWARFLAAKTAEERRKLAMSNPQIQKANDALEVLSQDPKARDLARWREHQLELHRVEMAEIKRQGIALGIEEGIEQGIEKGQLGELRATLRGLCEAFEIEPTPEQEAAVEELGVDALRRLNQHLLAHRRWPE